MQVLGPANQPGIHFRSGRLLSGAPSQGRWIVPGFTHLKSHFVCDIKLNAKTVSYFHSNAIKKDLTETSGFKHTAAPDAMISMQYKYSDLAVRVFRASLSSFCQSG